MPTREREKEVERNKRIREFKVVEQQSESEVQVILRKKERGWQGRERETNRERCM